MSSPDHLSRIADLQAQVRTLRNVNAELQDRLESCEDLTPRAPKTAGKGAPRVESPTEAPTMPDTSYQPADGGMDDDDKSRCPKCGANGLRCAVDFDGEHLWKRHHCHKCGFQSRPTCWIYYEAPAKG